MDATTLRALRGSIRKWRMILAEEATDRGTDNCSLCSLFYKDECRGCPVRAVSGCDFCGNTPYSAWSNLNTVQWWPDRPGKRHEVPEGVHHQRPGNHFVVGSQLRGTGTAVGHLTVAGYQAARAELEFLISLLPPGEPEIDPLDEMAARPIRQEFPVKLVTE